MRQEPAQLELFNQSGYMSMDAQLGRMDIIKNKLSTLAKSETGRIVFDGLRHVPLQTTKLEVLFKYISKDARLTKQGFDAFFKELETQGFGRIFIGGKFQWNYNVRQLGRYAAEQCNL